MYGYANERALCSFGAAGKGNTKLVYNDATILLTMAIADNVLVAVKAVKEALEIPLGEDEPRLVYVEGAEGKSPPIYHKGATNALNLGLRAVHPV